MKITERELNKMIQEAITEYGDNWNYPAGADNSSAPWNRQEAKTEDVDCEKPFKTIPLFLYFAKEYMDIEDEGTLSSIKSVLSKLPETIFLRAKYEVPFEWERDEDGGFKNHNYSEAELITMALCVKDGGQYTTIYKLLEGDNDRAVELVKKIADEFVGVLEEYNIGPDDIEGYHGKHTELDVIEKGINDFATATEPGQNVLNESDMRNYIYEEVKKMLSEKSVSKAQQRFMGMVRGVQTGEVDPDSVSDSVKDAAANMKKKDVKDFASTKHKGLPNHVNKTKKEE